MWEPILAIADLMGPEVGVQARKASTALHPDRVRDLGEDLLRDLLTIFARRRKGMPKARPIAFRPTESLLAALWKMDDRPWCEMPYSHKPLTPHKLAKLLERFDISPVRPEKKGPHGYLVRSFVIAWRRYLTDAASTRLIRRLSEETAQPAQAASATRRSGHMGRSGRMLAGRPDER